MRRFGRLTAALVALAAVATLGAGTGAGASETGRYIVQLDDPPLATYAGGINGLAPTSARARGEARLDPTSAASRAYLAHLQQQHAAVVAAAERALRRDVAVLFDYRYAFNGFATVLSRGEAALVAQLPGVAEVEADFERQLLTDAGPAWIGAPSVWSGSSTGGLPGTKGEGVVVGVIDTGINHDHPSFADKGGDGYDHTNPRGAFYGACDPVLGTPFCNDKLIGVWDFTGTTPEDTHGHGSHTASTAAGNAVSATIKAPTLTVTRDLSGVAPHANLITYKACITSCPGVSLVAAIDQATADGVDVVNYSIGGGPNNPWNDADSEAFLAAREAGVFVATSAGNSGPGAETVGSPANAPWLMSVGASTHNRAFVNSVTNMSGGATTPPGTLTGKSFTSGYGPAAIVYAGDYGDNLCAAPFAPGTFNGEIVVCDRGVNARVAKGENVKVGGAGGLVLVNAKVDGESTVADSHSLPAVHLGYKDGVTLKAWVEDGGSGHTATIAGTTADTAAENGDVMAGFSSRGPNKPVPGVIKPDVTAPGVDVLAAIATTATVEPEYGLMSGTSMSSPHAAGAAALVRALHRDWTPAEVQSALTTTGVVSGVRKDDGVKAADAFDMGGGRVDLTQAGAAALVLDETAANFAAADPRSGGDPTALNLATIGHADCESVCGWTRTVRSALGGEATWSAKVNVPRGIKLTVEPSRFTLAGGATQALSVTADVSDAPVGKWVLGEIVLSAKGVPSTRFPVAILPGGAPKLVGISTTSTSGTHTVSLTSKVDIKDLQTGVFGLAEGRIEQRQLEQDPTPLQPYDTSVGTFFVTLDVPTGARFVTAEIGKTTSIDLDLFIGRDADGDGSPDANEELCRSASSSSAESCRLKSPAGGTYWVMVQNWLSGRVVDDVELIASVIPGADVGNLTVSGPKSVAAGTPFDLTLAWNEPALEVGDTWFALVELGADKQHPTNVGSLLVKLTRSG